MSIFPRKKKDLTDPSSYANSKEYLERQQNIDLLLVLNGLVQPGLNLPGDTIKEVQKMIDKTVEKLK